MRVSGAVSVAGTVENSSKTNPSIWHASLTSPFSDCCNSCAFFSERGGESRLDDSSHSTDGRADGRDSEDTVDGNVSSLKSSVLASFELDEQVSHCSLDVDWLSSSAGMSCPSAMWGRMVRSRVMRAPTCAWSPTDRPSSYISGSRRQLSSVVSEMGDCARRADATRLVGRLVVRGCGAETETSPIWPGHGDSCFPVFF